MSSPLLVVGLGNPGPKYQRTRHNVGFRVADELADRLDTAFDPANNALIAWGMHNSRDVGIAKPLTYVNRSGDAVLSLCQTHSLSPAQVLIVVDDLNLAVGRLRLRPKGSSGGHNGLAHIADRLGTTGFPRLRIGIGDDFVPGEQVDYVLSPFGPEQRPLVKDAIGNAVKAVFTIVEENLDVAMNRFN